MKTDIDPAYTIALLAGEYSEIMGESLDWRIIGFLSAAGYSLTERDIRSILEKVPAAAVLHLAERITGLMSSPEVREKLIAQKAAEFEVESYDYEFEPEIATPTESAIEFVDVDPETQAQIIRMMRDQDNA